MNKIELVVKILSATSQNKDAVEVLKRIALGTGYVLIIAILVALIYVTGWAAAFYPINKNRKHKEAVAESEREYNKIQVEKANAIQIREEATEDLKKLVYQAHLKQQEIEDADKALEAKKIKDDELADSIKQKEQELARINKRINTRTKK